ncbi:MAG: glycosyltransferase [Candidatus Bipolaricaulis sp.]|nr:glycosyltransferase [Candidatus Bipolaricaulis sp.]
MKVVHVCCDTAYGCLSAVAEIAAAEAGLGLDVDVVLLQERGRRVSAFRLERMRRSSVGTHVLPLAKLRRWMRPRLVARGLEISTVASRIATLASGSDLVHGHGTLGAVYAYFAARRLGIPAVATRHGAEPGAFRPVVWRCLSTRLDRHTSMVSPRRTKAAHRTAAREVPGLGNGIDAAVWRAYAAESANARESLGIPPDAFVIGLIGRLVREKRQASTLQALTPYADEVHVLVIGDGPQRTEIERLAMTPSWRGRLHLLGFVDDVPTIYRALDLLWMPSLRESESMVVLEAMASGVPVLASAVGATPRLLDDGAGILFAPDDLPGAVRIARALARDPGRREELVGRAQTRVLEHFSAAAAAHRYIHRLYRPALDAPPDGPRTRRSVRPHVGTSRSRPRGTRRPGKADSADRR